ncbi:transcriptional regulator NanR [Dongshaea marina]|uniref:transcriptional regulator NanR n=1 Tax=Dongshaea marina TaxID=2047966 RepID=UPI000D3EDAEC|nr:transcriptional regulator NanR [Dongshaea marina]
MSGKLRTRPVSRKKLSDMVEEQLESMIRSGEFAEGEKLPSERELMTLFEVGRPSVREAMASLARKGLLKITSGERARVTSPSPDAILGELSGLARDFMAKPEGIGYFEQLREFFESSLARYAAEHAGDRHCNELRDAVENCRLAIGKEPLFSDCDIEFHRILATIPENPIFLAIHQALVNWLITRRGETDDLESWHQRVYREHRALCEAICQHDIDAAEKALRQHLQNLYHEPQGME